MQTFAKTPRQETSKERGGSAQQSQSAESSSLRGLMALQRTAGNAAVGQLLRGAIAKAKAEQEAPETQAESDRESERAPIPRRERDRQRERKENPSGTENGIEQGVLQSEQASPPAEVSGSLPASEGPIATDRATVGGSDNQFVSLTQAPASDIVQRIHGGFANDLKDEFASVRLASAERAPVLRVSLPGDELAPAKPKAPAPSKLPSADRIAVPEGNAEDNLAAEETAVPLQPGGDAVQTSAGFAPRIRLDGAAAPSTRFSRKSAQRFLRLPLRQRSVAWELNAKRPWNSPIAASPRQHKHQRRCWSIWQPMFPPMSGKWRMTTSARCWSRC